MTPSPPDQDPDDEVVGYEGYVGPFGRVSLSPVTRGELARRPGCGAVLGTALVLEAVAPCALADDGPRVFGLPAWATPGFLLSLGFNVSVGAGVAGVIGLLLGAPRAGCAAVVVVLAVANGAWGVHAGRDVLSWRLVGAAVVVLAGLGVGRALARAVRPRSAPPRRPAGRRP